MSPRLRWRIALSDAALARDWSTARGTLRDRAGWLVTCHDGMGVVGFGEIALLPGWGTESAEVATAALARLPSLGMKWDEDEAAMLLAAGFRREDTPAVYAGLELALLDCAARRAGISLARYLGQTHAAVPVALSTLVLATEPDAAAQEAAMRVAEGYRALKLKVGVAALAEDVARVLAVRCTAGDGVAIRLDANGAWSRDQAREALLALAAARPTYVEQPCPADDPAALAWLRRETGVGVAADEALSRPGGPEALAAAGPIDAWVIKPTVLGGLRVSMRLAMQAREQGVAVVLSAGLDRGVATAGALHLAAVLGVAGPHGLAAPDALAGEPVLEGLATLGPTWTPTSAPGLGFEPLGDLAALRAAPAATGLLGPLRRLPI